MRTRSVFFAGMLGALTFGPIASADTDDRPWLGVIRMSHEVTSLTERSKNDPEHKVSVHYRDEAASVTKGCLATGPEEDRLPAHSDSAH